MHTHETDSEGGFPRKPLVTRRPEEGTLKVSRVLADRRPDGFSAHALLHLQRTAGNAVVSALVGEGEEAQTHSAVREVVGHGGGRPLDDATRSFMEARLGDDFSDVRVHTDSQARESARSVNAQAYTVGTDVVLQSDKYAPDSDLGKRLLAHELTHVMQQKSGPVAGTPAPGGIKISDPSDSFEQAAERSAERVMLGGAGSDHVVDAQRANAAVQREETLDEVQGYFIQRQEGEPEEKEEEEALT